MYIKSRILIFLQQAQMFSFIVKTLYNENEEHKYVSGKQRVHPEATKVPFRKVIYLKQIITGTLSRKKNRIEKLCETLTSLQAAKIH